MAWALRKDGKEIARHSTREACLIEAIERGWVLRFAFDFPGERAGHDWAKGVEIKEDANPVDWICSQCGDWHSEHRTGS